VASRTLLFTKIIAAIAQYLTAAILLAGKSLTPQALSAIFQAYLQAEKNLDAARQQVTAMMQARDAALAAADAAVPDLRKQMASAFGEQSTTYAAFGFPVTQKAELTADQKAARAAKAKATRAAHEAALEAVDAHAAQQAAPAAQVPPATPPAPKS
jgi:hypothetical protein